MKKTPPNTAILILSAVIIVVLGFIVLRNNGSYSPDRENEISLNQDTAPKPKPRPLVQGKETFTYSPGPKAVGPKISEFSLDPMDPKVGQKQTITVKASYTSPITSVTAQLDTDNKKTNLVFTQVGDQWQATRIEDDTHDHTYYVYFTLVGSPDTYKGGFAFR